MRHTEGERFRIHAFNLMLTLISVIPCDDVKGILYKLSVELPVGLVV